MNFESRTVKFRCQRLGFVSLDPDLFPQKKMYFILAVEIYHVNSERAGSLTKDWLNQGS